MKKLNIKHLLLLLAFSFLVVACSKEDPAPSEPDKKPEEVKKSTDNSLHSFSFAKASNAGLVSDCKPVANGTLLYITVPEEATLSALIPSIKVHEKAKVTVNGTAYDQNAPVAVNFTKNVKIAITSESGSTKTYTVLAKNGNVNIDNRVYDFMKKHNLPGVSIAISKDEEIVYRAGYGFADKSKEERVTVDHLFRLASMSKQHAAIAIMSLYEQGLVKLDDIVFGEKGILSKYGSDMSSTAKRITVENLLNHTSGYTDDCIFPSKSMYYNKTLDERIQTLVDNASVDYIPGTTHKYNNTNFGVLSMIVEVISGKTFEEYIKDLYAQYDIKDICGGKNNESQKLKNEVSYYGQDGKNAYGNDVENGIGAGGIIATPTALMKLMAHIDYGTKVADMFKKETLGIMYKPMENVVNTSGNPYQKYALGWRCKYTDFPNWPAFHGGTLAGVCTIWSRNVSNVNGVILCNSRSYNQDIDDEMWYLLEDFQDMYK